MNPWKILMMVLLVSVWLSVPTAGLAAQKGATRQKAADASAAEKAMTECAAMYCGRRSPSIAGYRPFLIENCFKQKMGEYPAKMGVALHPHCSVER
jgi:hypothetical protein